MAVAIGFIILCVLSNNIDTALAIKFDAHHMSSTFSSTMRMSSSRSTSLTNPASMCCAAFSTATVGNTGNNLQQYRYGTNNVDTNRSISPLHTISRVGHHPTRRHQPIIITSLSAAQSSSCNTSNDSSRSSGRFTSVRKWARNKMMNSTKKVATQKLGISCIATTSSNNMFSRLKQLLPKSSKKQSGERKRLPYGLICAFITLLVTHTSLSNNNILLPLAHASGGMVKRDPDAVITPLSKNELVAKLLIWLGIFTALALFHAAEIAITTLYPWKVREFAEEEEKQSSTAVGGKKGRRGTFTALNEDITRVLTTILVTSTACSIYATTLFTHLADHIFGTYAEKWSAIFLTAVTLFFVELLPKNIGVINAERVARLMVPPINMLANVVGPFGFALSTLAKATLRLFGVRTKENSGVTDSELRLIVTGARDSGTIDHSEQEMIKGVLNLQDQKVREIMKPRVEVVAVPKSMSVASVLGVVRNSGYSRIPVYDGEIDNIVGIVLAKSVLDFFVKGVLVDGDYKRPNQRDDSDPLEENVNDDGEKSESSSTTTTTTTKPQEDIGKLSFIDPPTGKTMDRYVRSLTGTQLASRMETTIDDAGLIESCYFVPEAANGWSVLQEMRRRRVHMAVVVDEYGGTEGLVSLEDIVEEVSLLCICICI